jgi:hypothetical protein
VVVVVVVVMVVVMVMVVSDVEHDHALAGVRVLGEVRGLVRSMSGALT